MFPVIEETFVDLPLNCLGSFVEIQLTPYMWIISELHSVLLISLSFRQCYTILITVDL